MHPRPNPRPIGVALVVLSLIASTLAAGAFLAKEMTGFAEELPRYQENLRTKTQYGVEQVFYLEKTVK